MINMKDIVILLTAGKGNRIYPLTKYIPKALIKIENHSLLERLMVGFALEGFNKFLIVTGHRNNAIEHELKTSNYGNAKEILIYNIIYNKNYINMNNAESVRLAIQFILSQPGKFKDDLFIVNTDIIFNHNLLRRLYNTYNTKVSALLSDGTKNLTNESMKVTVNKKGYLQSISKKLPNNTSDGEYIGVTKIVNKDIKKFYWCLKWLLFWCDPKYLFYEQALYMLVLLNTKIRVHSFDGDNYLWTEIDDFNDLKRAKRIVKRDDV